MDNNDVRICTARMPEMLINKLLVTDITIQCVHSPCLYNLQTWRTLYWAGTVKRNICMYTCSMLLAPVVRANDERWTKGSWRSKGRQRV